MDDFNSFVNHTDQREEANNAPPADLSRLIRQLAGKYNGANEAELMQAIYKEAEKGRRNGTLSDALLLLVRETGLFLAAVHANGAAARSGRL